MAVTEGTLLWDPSPEFKRASTLARYLEWLEGKGLTFQDYEQLWQWSVTNIEDFWESVWDFFEVKGAKRTATVLEDRRMPGARWFPEAELNYAENVFRNATTERPALVFRSELRPYTEIGWADLEAQVASVASALRDLGIRRGDRVAAYIPNIPETVVAFLACASIGAIWSSCSPDFGTPSVVDRFRQIEPSLLIAVDGYSYGGTRFDRRAVVQQLRDELPTLKATVMVPYLDAEAPPLPDTIAWRDLLDRPSAALEYQPLPFDHPLWILYTSGTTGLPKPIVHGHGGIILEHLKGWAFHLDLKPEDRFFWFTTTGWAMWNMVVAGLLAGSTIVLYDGSPAFPDLEVLWEFAETAGITIFGVSAAYLTTCMKTGLKPGTSHDLQHLRVIGSTGSPLPPEAFQWVYDAVDPNLWLVSASGGTDPCAPFVGGCPTLPVYAGEIQCRCLGAKVEAFDEKGQSLIDEVGELVVTEPMPSMPLFFWNDEANKRYLESYFEMYPGVWRHGDWIKITPRGSAIIYGRSDSTINRLGVRIGTSELYAAVEELPEVQDSLAVYVQHPDAGSFVPLFIVLKDGAELNESLESAIKEKIRADLSPRHVPDRIIPVPEVPRTLNGKKLEVPVTKLLNGSPLEKCVNLDSMSNPGSMTYFVQLADRLRTTKTI